MDTSDSQDRQPSGYELTVLDALQAKPIYQGTVSARAKGKRRAAGKVARKSRRANRGQR